MKKKIKNCTQKKRTGTLEVSRAFFFRVVYDCPKISFVSINSLKQTNPRVISITRAPFVSRLVLLIIYQTQ